MKNKIKCLISFAFVILLLSNNYAQEEITPFFGNGISLSNDEKQILISRLAVKSEASNAAFNVWHYKLAEAIPNLLKYYKDQEPESKYWFLSALAKCKYKGALQLFHDFIDSAEVYKLNPRECEKEEVAALLIELGDYSRRDVIYNLLEKDLSKLYRSNAIDALNNLLKNLPSEEERAKSQLIRIVRNAPDDGDRYISLVYLFDKYKDGIVSLLKERFVADTDYSIKLCILKDMLNQIRTNETVEFLKQQALLEHDLSIRHEILHSLLLDFNSPVLYKYVSDNKNLLDQWEHKRIILVDLHYFRSSLDSSYSLMQGLDTLISHHIQCTSLNWLSNQSFSEQIKTFLTETKAKIASGDSIGAALKIKLYQNQITAQYKDTVKTDGKFVTEEGYKFLYYYPKYILERLPKLPTTKLQDSQGKLLNGGKLLYYENGWKDAIDNKDGTFTVDTKLKTISLKMQYAFGEQTKSNVTVGKDTVVFQTVNALVKLLDSKGASIDTGNVQYYANGWRQFGKTVNGIANLELLPAVYTFKMNYGFASIDKQQNIAVNPAVEFVTTPVNVKLNSSAGSPLDGGTVQYYSNGWREFGTAVNGVAVKELLPVSYTFKMNYAFASLDKQQNVATNPTVEFATNAVNVKLKSSAGTPLDGGTVQYYSNGWREFGAAVNGVAVKELLPVSYTFKMNYTFASLDKQQNVATNPTVEFITSAVNVKLSSSAGSPLDGGTVQYYSNGWREFGNAVNGVAVKELLPVNYTFKMNYAFASLDKQQNVAQNSNVVFQTVNALVQLRDSQGNPLDGGTVDYYSNGWRSFGAATNGNSNRELLPGNYTFRMNHAFVSNEKAQTIGTNNIVTFSTTLCTINVKDAQNQPINNAMVSYYSNGWRQIGNSVNGVITKELLPANLTFRAISGTKQTDKQQNTGTNNQVELIIQ